MGIILILIFLTGYEGKLINLNMNENRFVCLLRGINVGGNNIIKMADLKNSFLKMGFKNPGSYIQSGNILFNSDEVSVNKITQKIEKKLSKDFSYQAAVVVFSKKDFIEIIKKAPKDFGKAPEKFRYDVLFFMEGEKPEKYFSSIEVKEGVDESYLGKRAVYFQRLIEKASQSKLNKLASSPVYKLLTIRNWNTCLKLYSLVQE